MYFKDHFFRSEISFEEKFQLLLAHPNIDINEKSLYKIDRIFTEYFVRKDVEFKEVNSTALSYSIEEDKFEYVRLSTIFRSLFKKITPEGWNNTKMIINILGISLGMKYLHDFRIIHQNLHPNNVLLDKRFYPKLSDIGLSRYNYCVGHVEISHPIYMAPEIISDDVYTYKIDVFSFGMILYGFYANSPPLVKGVTKYQVSKNIYQGLRPNVEKLNNGPVKSLIIKCWSQSAEERPSFDDIIRYYIEKREDFWPEDVDEDEVEHYLNKFGLSLDPHKNTEYFL